jgi:hypothetical protein
MAKTLLAFNIANIKWKKAQPQRKRKFKSYTWE